MNNQGDFTVPLNPKEVEEYYRAFIANFNSAINTLVEQKDKLAVQQFQQLAIFPENTSIPFATLATLWNVSAEEVRDICSIFCNLPSLPNDIVKSSNSISITEVLRTHLREINESQLVAWNRLFLDRYDLASRWHTLPNDETYLWENLVYHLLESDRKDLAIDLLIGSPAWMEAKYLVTGRHYGYDQDLTQVIQTFKNTQGVETVSKLTALWTARNSLYPSAETYTYELLKTLVYIGQEIKAFTLAKMRKERANRLEGMVVVISAMHEIDKKRDLTHYLDFILAEASSYSDVWNHDKNLLQIANLYVKQGHLEQALRVANSIANKWHQVQSLCQIAKEYFQQGQRETAQSILDKALQTTHSIDYEDLRIDCLLEIANTYPQERQPILEGALRIVHSMKNDGDRTGCLIKIARCYAQYGQFIEALKIANSLDKEWEWRRSISLSEIASAYAQQGRIDDAWQITQSLEELNRDNSLRQIVSAYVKQMEFTKALEVAHTIEYVVTRVESLCEIANTYYQNKQFESAQGILQEALVIAHSVEYTDIRDDCLKHIANTYAKQDQTEQVLTTARLIEYGQWKVFCFGNIANIYAKRGQIEIAQSILDEALKESCVARYAESGLRRFARVFAQQRQTEKSLAIISLLNINSGDWIHGDTLCDISQIYARRGQFEEAFTVTKSIPEYDEQNYVTSLSYIVASLIEQGRLDEARDVAQSIRGHTRAVKENRLREVALAYIHNQQLEKAVEIVQLAEDDRKPVESLCHIAVTYTQQGKLNFAQTIMDEILEYAQVLQDEWIRSVNLRYIVTAYAQQEQFEQAKTIADSITDEWCQSRSFGDIVEAYIQLGEFENALTITRLIERNDIRVDSLHDIVNVCVQQGREDQARSILDEALMVARETYDVQSRANCLCKIADAYYQLGDRTTFQSLLNEAVKAARIIIHDHFRPQTLAQIVYKFAKHGYFDEALDLANRITEIRRNGIMQVILAYCQQGNFTEALTTTSLIYDTDAYHDALWLIGVMWVKENPYQSFNLIGICDSDEFIWQVLSLLNRNYPDNAADIIINMIRIASWNDLPWREVYEAIENAEELEI